jgi:hypothetical protein
MGVGRVMKRVLAKGWQGGREGESARGRGRGGVGRGVEREEEGWRGQRQMDRRMRYWPKGGEDRREGREGAETARRGEQRTLGWLQIDHPRKRRQRCYCRAPPQSPPPPAPPLRRGHCLCVGAQAAGSGGARPPTAGGFTATHGRRFGAAASAAPVSGFRRPAATGLSP